MPLAPTPDVAPPQHCPGFFARRILELAQSLRFYSRLPVPRLPFEADPHAAPDLAQAIWSVPLVGAVLGAIGALVGFVAIKIALPPLMVAALSLTMLVIITGCFHEDGLADSADGLWGGMNPERRLEIMRDSRIGTYGGAALILSLALRLIALTELIWIAGAKALLLLIGIGAISRFVSLLLGFAQRPARQDGVLMATSGRSNRLSLWCGALITLTILIASFWHVMPFSRGWFVLLLLSACVAWLCYRLARAKLGGVTGDILGATQQMIEITLLIACLSILSGAPIH